MSHWTKIDVKIRDIEALRVAGMAFNAILKRSAQARGYHTQIYPWVLDLSKTSSDYDVGFEPSEEAGQEVLTPVYDKWLGHVENVLGPELARLRDEYAVAAIQHQAALAGQQVVREQAADGSIVLTVQCI